jgi:hypothetical protein
MHSVRHLSAFRKGGPVNVPYFYQTNVKSLALSFGGLIRNILQAGRDLVWGIRAVSR